MADPWKAAEFYQQAFDMRKVGETDSPLDSEFSQAFMRAREMRTVVWSETMMTVAMDGSQDRDENGRAQQGAHSALQADSRGDARADGAA